METEIQRTFEAKALMEKIKRATDALIAKWHSNGLTNSEQIAEDVDQIGVKCGIPTVSDRIESN